MAKKSSVIKNNKRAALVARYKEKRAALKAKVHNMNLSLEERIEAQQGLQAIPRNACPTRVRNRCALTGRSRGYIGMFGLSRIKFRELALLGVLPGVKKASW